MRNQTTGASSAATNPAGQATRPLAVQERKRSFKGLRSMPLGDFLCLDLPRDTPLLGEVITRGSTGMLSAPRGLGKSLLSLTMGYAVAAGKSVRPWGKGIAAVVVYLDGEMHASTLQKRLRQLQRRDTDPATQELAKANLHIINRHLASDVIGYIDDEEGQHRIEALLPEGCALLIIDNLSAWTGNGREDASSFAPIKKWLGRLRAQGIAVLMVHHTGKRGGDQRGTSVHEDMLDYSILLSPDKRAKPRNGTCFQVQHTKLRELHPDLPELFRVAITTEDGVMGYRYEEQETENLVRDAEIAALLDKGLTGQEIAAMIEVSASTVSRAKARIEAQRKLEAASEADDVEGSEHED